MRDDGLSRLVPIAALLHAGGEGYLLRHAAQRRLREAYFIGIVTPALKHVRYELAKMGG